jgi:cell division protein FtsL
MKGASLKIFIVIIVGLAISIFAYVAVLNEIKNLNKEKLNKTEVLKEKQNRIEALNVEIQKLTAEDRIVTFAIDSLRMNRPKEILESIFVSKEQIKQIEKILQEKYD